MARRDGDNYVDVRDYCSNSLAAGMNIVPLSNSVKSKTT